jgi:hypothetical protein
MLHVLRHGLTSVGSFLDCMNVAMGEKGVIGKAEKEGSLLHHLKNGVLDGWSIRIREGVEV